MGDLNFRMSSDVSAEEIVSMSKKGNIEELYKLDELNKAQNESDAFEPLIEAPLTFPPTYKYKDGTASEYDLK